MKIVIWHITGYKGFDDYDGPSDNNINVHIAMDAKFSKKHVEKMLLKLYEKYRTVVLSVEKEKEMEVAIDA